MNKLKSMGGNPKLRMATAKSGPLITDNGNFIIDVDFGTIKNPLELNQKLLNIPGVVDTGLFVNMASKAYIGNKDGTVIIIQK
jgi:ribose 5-phosphate isomerase A